MKREEGIKALILSTFILVIFLVLLAAPINAQNSESSTEWWMFGKYLNHTSWDGIPFQVISGLNNVTFSIGLYSNPSSAAIANGSVYIGSDFEGLLYQLNASNISQQINNYSVGSYAYISPIVANGYVYFGGSNNSLYQLNASNISQQIANFTTGDNIRYSPIFANNSIFLGSNDGYLYQLNASNISKQINNISIGTVTTSPAIANGYIYVGGGVGGGGKGGGTSSLYQLNASNISQQIANFTLTSATISSSPAVFNNSVYVGDNVGNFYQLNATNISQQISTFVSAQQDSSSPAITNGYVYVPIYTLDGTMQIYQLNATNISQQISTFIPNGGGSNSPAITNGYLYIATSLGGGAGGMIYQLNASNISQQISNITTLFGTSVSSPSISIANGYLYLGLTGSTNSGGIIYQLNALNISLTNPCYESWACTVWSTCFGSVQTRTCTDANSCQTYQSEPAISQSCSSSSGAASLTNTTANENITANLSTVINTTTSGSTASGTFTQISQGSPATMNVNSGSFGITSLVITTNRTVSNAIVNISTIKTSKTTDLNVKINGQTYQSFQINTSTINDSSITNVTIFFKVNVSWFTQNRLNPLNVSLYRNINEPLKAAKWIALPTNLTKNDSQYYYYTSVSPGFSDYTVFAAQLSPNTPTVIQNFLLGLGNILNNVANNKGSIIYIIAIVIISGFFITYFILRNARRRT